MNVSPIKFGQGWNCCKDNPTHVITFDEGTRWAVCTSCANQYTGPVEPLPAPVAEIKAENREAAIEYFCTEAEANRRALINSGSKITDAALTLCTQVADAYTERRYGFSMRSLFV